MNNQTADATCKRELFTKKKSTTGNGRTVGTESRKVLVLPYLIGDIYRLKVYDFTSAFTKTYRRWLTRQTNNITA